MSSNTLSMSLDDIIRSNKKSQKSKPGRGGGSKPGRGGPKPGFKNVANNTKQKQVQRGVATRGIGKGRQGAFNNTRKVNTGNSFRGRRGSMRGRNSGVNRAFTAQTTKERLQFKRLNNKINIVNLKNRQRLGQRNVNVSPRLEQRNKRFSGGNPGNRNNAVRYFTQRSRINWKTKGSVSAFPGSTLKKVRNPKLKGKRTIQTLARQKVQKAKARLVLTNRNPIGRRPTKIIRSAVPVTQLQGIRRSKFGFVTVRNRNEKRQVNTSMMAVQTRNRITNRSTAWQGTSSDAVSMRNRNRSRGGRGRGQVSLTNNLVQVRIPNDFRPQFSVQNTPASYGGYPGNGSAYPANNYSLDPHGMAMQEEMMRPTHHQRHTVVRPAGPSDGHEFAMSRGALDPEIQRKISFIQSRASGQSYNVLPDFKAPVSTSQMKLSERFRMFMQ